MQPEAPKAVSTGISFVGFLTILSVVSLDGIHHANSNLGDEVINGI
jgi:hypothetical protein